ncbi:MAG: hypothetical protein QOD63_487 [Actinomycetota bacterium]|nr:hypothetical protein [Actinomycetota bacterium]
MRAVLVGAGAVGARAARQLVALGDLDQLVVVDPDGSRCQAVLESFGPIASSAPDLAGALDVAGGGAKPPVVILTSPPGDHPELAGIALAAGAIVVSTADSVDDVSGLLALDATARALDLAVVVGTGFSPGLSCVLAAFAARSFEQVDEVHVAKVGSGGPACHRQRLAATRSKGPEWAGGRWVEPGSAGRQLCWFPDPIGGVDCYRGALADPLLVMPAFPGVTRVTARIGAGRFDRLVARVPELRRFQSESDLGALRVEVRGSQGVARATRVVGAIDRPAVAAGVVTALAARWAVDGRLTSTGAAGLARMVEPGPFLASLADRGVKVAVFEGAAA